MKTYILFCITLLFISCSGGSSVKRQQLYSDKYDMPNVDSIQVIEFRHGGSDNCGKVLFNEFELSNKAQIKQFLSILKNSKQDGLWKGACFDKINLVTFDSTVVISTNGKVFGHGNSGLFYRFPDENTIDNFRSIRENKEQQ
jgi:hypothetical protein